METALLRLLSDPMVVLEACTLLVCLALVGKTAFGSAEVGDISPALKPSSLVVPGSRYALGSRSFLAGPRQPDGHPAETLSRRSLAELVSVGGLISTPKSALTRQRIRRSFPLALG